METIERTEMFKEKKAEIMTSLLMLSKKDAAHVLHIDLVTSIIVARNIDYSAEAIYNLIHGGFIDASQAFDEEIPEHWFFVPVPESLILEKVSINWIKYLKEQGFDITAESMAIVNDVCNEMGIFVTCDLPKILDNAGKLSKLQICNLLIGKPIYEAIGLTAQALYGQLPIPMAWKIATGGIPVGHDIHPAEISAEWRLFLTPNKDGSGKSIYLLDKEKNKMTIGHDGSGSDVIGVRIDEPSSDDTTKPWQQTFKLSEVMMSPEADRISPEIFLKHFAMCSSVYIVC